MSVVTNADMETAEYDALVTPEIWQQVRDTRFAVSNLGNVKNTKSGKSVSKSTNTSGYHMVNIIENDGKVKYTRVHRLVAESFLENPDNKLEVDHIDRNRTNNQASNLRYATRTENARNGTKRSCNKSGVVGVGKVKGKDNWTAVIGVNCKLIHLGYYSSFDEAVASRKAGELKYFGAYALNT